MPAVFNYIANSINKDNHSLDFQQSQVVIAVPIDSPFSGTNRDYDNFYWISPNPVTPVEQMVPDESEEAEEGDLVELLTYSKLEMRFEAVEFLMVGPIRLAIGGNWFIKLPSDFDINDVEQWMIGGEYYDVFEPATAFINSFVAMRAYDYGNAFTKPETFGVGGSPEITLEDVHEVWSASVKALLAVKYP